MVADDPNNAYADNDDKLRNGPCHETFALLEGCRKAKNVQRATNALTSDVTRPTLVVAPPAKSNEERAGAATTSGSLMKKSSLVLFGA
jgi:hypothetical protein